MEGTLAEWLVQRILDRCVQGVASEGRHTLDRGTEAGSRWEERDAQVQTVVSQIRLGVSIFIISGVTIIRHSDFHELQSESKLFCFTF